jgi:heme/copper-type cytochrome/quinol oxidase subunit 2
MKIWIMNPSTVYLLIAIVALVAIVIFAFLIKPARQKNI